LSPKSHPKNPLEIAGVVFLQAGCCCWLSVVATYCQSAQWMQKWLELCLLDTVTSKMSDIVVFKLLFLDLTYVTTVW